MNDSPSCRGEDGRWVATPTGTPAIAARRADLGLPWLRWLGLAGVLAGLSFWGGAWGCRGSGRNKEPNDRLGATVSGRAQPAKGPAPEPREVQGATRAGAPVQPQPHPAPRGPGQPEPRGLFHGRIEALSPNQPLQGSEDLDGDGRPDRWKAAYHGGSGFGGVTLTLTSTRLGQTFTLEASGSFGRFLQAVILPPPLAALPPLVLGVVRLLYGESHLRALSLDPPPARFRYLFGPGTLRRPRKDVGVERLPDRGRVGVWRLETGWDWPEKNLLMSGRSQLR